MNEIERKALAWINQVAVERGGNPVDSFDFELDVIGLALIRAIEQHEAFRQEVSDAIAAYVGTDNYLGKFNDTLSRFIIAKPDPLVEAVKDCQFASLYAIEDYVAKKLRAAIEQRGGKIIFNEEQK